MAVAEAAVAVLGPEVPQVREVAVLAELVTLLPVPVPQILVAVLAVLEMSLLENLVVRVSSSLDTRSNIRLPLAQD